jgi:predicted DNA-binding ribbon-helix-helix protein
MKSAIVKRSIVVAGHKTSVSLEDAFWESLKDIAGARRVALSDLVGGVDTNREHGNLSSAIRLFVLGHYQKRATSDATVEVRPRRRIYERAIEGDGRCCIAEKERPRAGPRGLSYTVTRQNPVGHGCGSGPCLHFHQQSNKPCARSWFAA